MQKVKDFFERYSSLSQASDLEAIAACYAKNFIAAGPGTVLSFDNDKKFLEWLKGVQDFNQQSGLQVMRPEKIISTAIGQAYTNAVVTWSVEYAAKKDHPIEFDITYILSNEGDAYKIVAFISHEDQEEV